jgi:hypothetical protein
MSAAATQAPEIRVEIAPPSDERKVSSEVLAIGFVLFITALIAWSAARYLNWAMAPRGFWTRVVTAGILPVGMLILVMVAASVAQGTDLLMAIAALGNMPNSGRLLLLGMSITGLGVAWTTAKRREWRDDARNNAAIEAFE